MWCRQYFIYLYLLDTKKLSDLDQLNMASNLPTSSLEDFLKVFTSIQQNVTIGGKKVTVLCFDDSLLCFETKPLWVLNGRKTQWSKALLVRKDFNHYQKVPGSAPYPAVPVIIKQYILKMKMLNYLKPDFVSGKLIAIELKNYIWTVRKSFIWLLDLVSFF